MLSKGCVISVADSSVSADFEREAIILNSNTGLYYGLENVGARVWSLLQKPITVLELIETVASEYEVETERCENDLNILLEEFVAEGLVEVKKKSVT